MPLNEGAKGVIIGGVGTREPKETAYEPAVQGVHVVSMGKLGCELGGNVRKGN